MSAMSQMTRLSLSAPLFRRASTSGGPQRPLCRRTERLWTALQRSPAPGSRPAVMPSPPTLAPSPASPEDSQAGIGAAGAAAGAAAVAAAAVAAADAPAPAASSLLRERLHFSDPAVEAMYQEERCGGRAGAAGCRQAAAPRGCRPSDVFV